ncbi:hypothetical protein [Desulfobacula phenolica]|uniref:Type II restriction enzyme n=1 Tax=Desulfobacula phenolica TaxID=90732 RepID=A0A1H2HJ50_9BACT|nr:hypothetical protein [Desulfobacula phenolica]SDU31907.1 hypothetical protein SAMN04487931_106278 [Desulfobacula phenolica]
MDKLFKQIKELNGHQQKRVSEFISSIGKPLDEIFIQIEKLNKFKQQRVFDFIKALNKPLKESTNKDSEYVNSAFSEEFRSRILTQHAFQNSPLFQDSFDSAFMAASKASGKDCKEAPIGERFWDVEVDGLRISLKSTREKNLSSKTLKISKLTEAAWIQDCRSAAIREERTKNLFIEYMDIVGSIIQLRYFKKKQMYELVEIPMELFKPILDVPRSYFNSDGPTINIPVGENPPNLKLRLDRSDAKITIVSILKERCIVHGTWQLI